jgi:hypothetical protein
MMNSTTQTRQINAGGSIMVDTSIKEATSVSGRNVWIETLVYRLLVSTLFIVSAVVLLGARLTGAERTDSLFTEARQTAYAVAGYAFKY